MVVRRTIHRLRERPKDERAALAGSIAIGVIVVLFIGWGFFFLRNVSSNPPDINLSGIGSTTLSSFQSLNNSQTQQATTTQTVAPTYYQPVATSSAI